MAKFEKGNAGRPPGSTNKSNNEIKTKVLDFLTNNMETIQNDFNKAKPSERLDFISKLIPYAVPKLQNTQVSQEGDINIRITHES